MEIYLLNAKVGRLQLLLSFLFFLSPFSSVPFPSCSYLFPFSLTEIDTINCSLDIHLLQEEGITCKKLKNQIEIQ